MFPGGRDEAALNREVFEGEWSATGKKVGMYKQHASLSSDMTSSRRSRKKLFREKKSIMAV